jgi:outer membrane protein OmpA-like peptidoglycan-associated protein
MTAMKRFLTCALAAAMVLVAIPAFAVHPSELDDMTWWGNTGATPEPVADPKGRQGYWWWPTVPASNAGDSELWGNRGIVYYIWAKEEVVVTPPRPPQDPPPPPVIRTPVESTVLFEFDKATLSPEGRAALNEVVADLKNFPEDTVTVEGHTDSTGSDAYNMALSERRAMAVVNYLVSQGIDRSRITAEWFGESRPAVPNDTPANRKLNRRVYFKTMVN